MSRQNQKYLLDGICYAILILGMVLMVGPFLWMVATSFKLPADQYSKTLIPPTFTLNNFRELFGVDLNFPLLFWNSIYISVLITVGQLLTCAMAAFCFAVVKFRGRDILFTGLLLTMLIPPQVTLIPNFIIFKYLHLIGTSLPLWLPAFWGGAFGTFLLRQYFLTIPRDLVDAARVDGASLLEIFWKIYMPLARPALAALAIFTFQGAWNDLLHPLVYMPSVPNTMLTVGLAFFQMQMTHGGKFTVLMAGALISILPLVIVFFFAQKQFIEGIALSGVKR
ncbi:MAG TPA: carbohydrate ABC transporter permease [Anaerolineales bacterium]|nr:carbohydrate ABC transporter permease [Anaerolineales bacterium]